MSGLNTFLNNASKIRAQEILVDVLRREDVRALVADLNTFGQLFEEGIDSEGRKLSEINKPYAPLTVEKKNREGLPSDRVTLFDTGRFYQSFDVRILDDGSIEIEATTQVEPTHDLEDSYGENIIGLTEDSIEKLIDYITPFFIEAFQAFLFRGV